MRGSSYVALYCVLGFIIWKFLCTSDPIKDSSSPLKGTYARILGDYSELLDKNPIQREYLSEMITRYLLARQQAREASDSETYSRLYDVVRDYGDVVEEAASAVSLEPEPDNEVSLSARIRRRIEADLIQLDRGVPTPHAGLLSM